MMKTLLLRRLLSDIRKQTPAQIDLEEDPEPEKVPQVSADEAIDMLEGLCWHEFQQEDGIMEVIQVLQKHEHPHAEEGQ